MSVKFRQISIVVSVVMLLLAMTPISSEGYYFLMRLVVSATAFYLVYQAKILKKKAWIWLMLVAAILFNPFLPIHLARVDFVLANLITVCLLIASLVKIKNEDEPPRLNKRVINIILVMLFFVVIISIALYSYFLKAELSF